MVTTKSSQWTFFVTASFRRIFSTTWRQHSSTSPTFWAMPHRPHAETERLRCLQGRLRVPTLLYAGADGRQSYLLTAEVSGTDAGDERPALKRKGGL
jgi:aminoglycoside phosphotransferase